MAGASRGIRNRRIVALAAPAAAQIPADVSMGFTFGAATPPVSGEVTEHLNDRLAFVGSRYWGSTAGASTVGFYVGPRLYTEPPARFRPFGGTGLRLLSMQPASAVAGPCADVHTRVGCRGRHRGSYARPHSGGLRADARRRRRRNGLSVTMALVLIPAREQ